MQMRKIRNINELYALAEQSEDYEKLAICASDNLGGDYTDLAGAMEWLRINVMETGSEEGVVDEINACRRFI